MSLYSGLVYMVRKKGKGDSFHAWALEEIDTLAAKNAELSTQNTRLWALIEDLHTLRPCRCDKLDPCSLHEKIAEALAQLEARFGSGEGK